MDKGDIDHDNNIQDGLNDKEEYNDEEEEIFQYDGLAMMRRNYLNKLGLFGSTSPPTATGVPSTTSSGSSIVVSNRNGSITYKEAPGNQQESFIQYGERDNNNRLSNTRPIQSEFKLNFGNVPERSADDFRMQYLKKLSYTGVWVPQAQKPPQHQTVIIFDWDDTLLCTSYLNLRAGQQQNRQDISKSVQKHLTNISTTDSKLLEMAMAHGETFIITNAMKGWVEYSARKYVPELLPTLRKVRIISARTEHERQYPGDYHQWKISAFLSVRQALNSQVITNLISLGDSNIEMDAIHVMGSEFSQALIKTIKFRENPSPDELAKQLELVYQKFDKILVNARNLKISLERKWIPSPKSRSPSPATSSSSSTAAAAATAESPSSNNDT